MKEYRGKDLNIREIGQRLGAGTIIEGSVRRDGDTVRAYAAGTSAASRSHAPHAARVRYVVMPTTGRGLATLVQPLAFP